MSCSYINTLTGDMVTSWATSSQLGDKHPWDHNLMGKEIIIHFFVNSGIIYYKLNYLVSFVLFSCKITQKTFHNSFFLKLFVMYFHHKNFLENILQFIFAVKIIHVFS